MIWICPSLAIRNTLDQTSSNGCGYIYAMATSLYSRVKCSSGAGLVWDSCSSDQTLSLPLEFGPVAIVVQLTISIGLDVLRLSRTHSLRGGAVRWATQNLGWVGHHAFGPANIWPVCSLVVARKTSEQTNMRNNNGLL